MFLYDLLFYLCWYNEKEIPKKKNNSCQIHKMILLCSYDFYGRINETTVIHMTLYFFDNILKGESSQTYETKKKNGFIIKNIVVIVRAFLVAYSQSMVWSSIQFYDLSLIQDNNLLKKKLFKNYTFIFGGNDCFFALCTMYQWKLHFKHLKLIFLRIKCLAFDHWMFSRNFVKVMMTFEGHSTTLFNCV